MPLKSRIAEEKLSCENKVPKQTLEPEGGDARETVGMENDEPSGSQEVKDARSKDGGVSVAGEGGEPVATPTGGLECRQTREAVASDISGRGAALNVLPDDDLQCVQRNR